MEINLEKELIVEIDTKSSSKIRIKQGDLETLVYNFTHINECGDDKEVLKFVDGKRISKKIIDKDTSTVLLEQPFKNNLIDGKVICRYQKTGRLESKRIYSEGNANGLEEGYYNIENSPIQYQINYKNGEYEGFTMWYYPNGNLQSRHFYKNGKQDGLWESWYENGIIRLREMYNDGNRNGLSEEFYESGNIKKRSIYKDDAIIEETWFQLDGKIKSNTKCNLVDGNIQSEIEIDYYPNGVVERSKTFVNGQLDGTIVHNYSTGKIRAIQTFKDGISVGPFTRYDEAGNIVCSFNCKNGFVIEFEEDDNSECVVPYEY